MLAFKKIKIITFLLLESLGVAAAGNQTLFSIQI